MLYKGFEMECIHRCISQMSCWWLRRAFLKAVSHVLFITHQSLLYYRVLHRKASHLLSSWKDKTDIYCCFQLFSLTWKLISMPECQWSFAKRRWGLLNLMDYLHICLFVLFIFYFLGFEWLWRPDLWHIRLIIIQDKSKEDVFFSCSS